MWSETNSRYGALEVRVPKQSKDVDIDSVDKAKIAQAFSRHAEQYTLCAQVQHRIFGDALARANTHFGDKRELLIDLGCGVGHNLAHLSPFAQRIMGVDIAPGMIAHNTSDYDIRQGDFDDLSLPDATVDYVFSSMALQWSAAPEKALGHIHRVLRPDGKAVLAIMVSPSFVHLRQAFATIGRESHINDFYAADEWVEVAQALFGAENVIASTEQYPIEFASFKAMMASIKGVGANTKLTLHTNAPLRKAEYQQVIAAFEGNFTLDYAVLMLELAR